MSKTQTTARATQVTEFITRRGISARVSLPRAVNAWAG